MNFDYSPIACELESRLRAFFDQHVLPANSAWHAHIAADEYPLAVVDDLKRVAQADGLWNLFLPTLKPEEPGTRLSNLDYAPLAEIMGRLPWCSEVFNCSPPDTGNMELLHLFATPDQYKSWLRPLLAGEIRSCFAMTEPEVASSDPTNLSTTIRREGDEYVINGRKWFITGALHPRCRFAIVLGVSNSDREADRYKRHSMVIVPMDATGVRIVRNLPLMNHFAPEGHCEMLFHDVRVPISNLVALEGEGLALAQARLGPGRVHHCMRTIGQCELALALMCGRVLERHTFGKQLSEYANIRDWIAAARMEIDQARLLVLRAAWLMDTRGNKAAKVEVSAIKVVAAQLQTRVLDHAMQVFGAMGLTNDVPLAQLWTCGRALRFIDGPDEVHMQTVARAELARAKAAQADFSAYYLRPIRGRA